MIPYAKMEVQCWGLNPEHPRPSTLPIVHMPTQQPQLRLNKDNKMLGMGDTHLESQHLGGESLELEGSTRPAKASETLSRKKKKKKLDKEIEPNLNSQ